MFYSDDIRERTYEESTMHRNLEPVSKPVNRELVSPLSPIRCTLYTIESTRSIRYERIFIFQVYTDTSTSRSKQTSPLPSTQRDIKYIHESSSKYKDS